MNFQPQSEKQIADAKLWPKGVYDFEITEAMEKDSKAGHKMIEVKLRLSNGNGKARVLTDYLLAETPEKLRHAAAACGLLDRYDTGSLADSDFRGKRGKLKLGVEKAKRDWPARNVIADYVCIEAGRLVNPAGGSPAKH
jgi:hypothetical protein